MAAAEGESEVLAGPEAEESEAEAAPELQEEEKEKEENEREGGLVPASAASLHSEAPGPEREEEEAGAEAKAESVSAIPSSEEEPSLAEAAAEGEAQAEEAEEKPEGEEAKAQEEEQEEEERPTKAPSEEEEAAAPSSEAEEEEEEEESRAPASLPTSSSFSAGELLEPPPLAVGVELGRRISRSLWELEQRCLSGSSLRLLGSSPESDASEVGAESEEQRQERLAQERRRREELADEYRQLQAERRRLRGYNAKLQGKLGELLSKGNKEAATTTATTTAPARAELEQHISDREQRYNRYLALLEELRGQQRAEGAWYQKQVEGLQGSSRERLATVEAEWKALQALKKEVAVFTMGRRLGGKQAAVREVDHIQAREQGKEGEMTEVRLEYIKLKHRIQKLEASLKAQEELAEGLHLIDFEQLKIENQTYNEKIEERNEELLKLRRRITNTVQITSQVKEKLQFVEAENQGQKAQLMAVEALVAQKREILTKTKQARDKLRMDNQRLQQKCGLLGHTLLLRDFENKVSASEALKERLDILKRRHAGLTLTCKGIKKKLQGVTSFLPL